MGGGGDVGKVLGHVGPSSPNNGGHHRGGGGGHRPHIAKHGGHQNSAAGGSASLGNIASAEQQGISTAHAANTGVVARHNAAAGGGGGNAAAAAGKGSSSGGGKTRSNKAMAAPRLSPGPGGVESPASRAQNLGEGGHSEEWRGAGLRDAPANKFCLMLAQLLCCGRRGARLAPLHSVLDEEAEELVELLQVSKAHLAKLEAIFEAIDISRTGTVYCSEVLSVVDMVQSPFTDNLFKLVGVHSDGSLTFSHLCRILMTYCVFSKEEILLFLFRQYDTDNSGAIDEREFRELAKTVNSGSPMFAGNFAKALQEFDTNSDGLIDFEEFRAMDKAFPLLFFPAFRLQDSLQKHFLGSSFWLKAQEGMVARAGIAQYQAIHGGKLPDKRGRTGRRR